MQFLMESPVGVAIGVTAAAAATYYLATKPRPFPLVVDMDMQSVELHDGSRCSTWIPDGKCAEYLYDDGKTTHELFKRGLNISRNRRCLGTRCGPNREYQWITYQEVYDMVSAFGAGLLQEGVEATNDQFIGIYSANRTEWVVTEQACSMFSMVPIALYDTLGPDTCAYIINQTSMTLIVCDTADKAQLLLNQADMKSLKCIVVMDNISKENRETAEKHGVKLIAFSEVMANGRKKPRKPVPPSGEDLAMISYTSGTTGDPKGAMLTHKNCISNISSISDLFQRTNTGINKNDSHLSYLPLAHMFERGSQMLMFMNGASIGFFSGDVKVLTDDMQALHPTLFPAVPRLLNRIYDKVISGVRDSKLKSTLFDWAMQSKEMDLKRCIIGKDSIWDKLVFGKIQKLVGGNVRLVVTGSAPLDPNVLNFTRIAFGCMVVEGYGQTENTVGMTFTLPGEYVPGHCGPPLTCNVVKLADIPEMGYFSKDNKGEVISKGPSVFIGYYKNKEKTEEALDNDGWLHTGDVGQWLPNGTLKIIDRKKNIFKLAQGEYVAVEKVENTYMRSHYVAQCFVEGDSLKPFLMGVMVPDEEVMTVWAKDNHVEGTFKQICSRKDVKDMILKDIIAVGRKAALKGFEVVKDIIIFPELFCIDNGLLTPTFKNKRPQLRKFFKNQIQDLYAKHPV